MKKMLLITVLIILVSCSSSKKGVKSSLPPVNGRYQDLPAWFINFPEGDFTVGIAKLTINDPYMKNTALQNATINYSRNHNCYVVNKKAIHQSELRFSGGENEFQVVVTSSPESLREISNKLKLIDYFWLYDNFVGLYSISEAKVDTSRFSTWINEYCGELFPEWFQHDLFKENGFIYTDVHATSHDFVTAWIDACNKARTNLAGYYSTKVENKVFSYNGNIDKLVALETSAKVMNINLNLINSRFYYSSGGPNYSVYLRMSMKDMVK